MLLVLLVLLVLLALLLTTAAPQFDHVHDYSYGGIMRSYEDSLQRLGLNKVDALVIHDLDKMHGNETWIAAHMTQV